MPAQEEPRATIHRGGEPSPNSSGTGLEGEGVGVYLRAAHTLDDAAVGVRAWEGMEVLFVCLPEGESPSGEKEKSEATPSPLMRQCKH